MQVESYKKDLPPSKNWPDFFRKTTLSLGSLLLASAAVSWIAANWDNLTAFQKLSGIQASLAVVILIVLLLERWLPAHKDRNFALRANLLALAGVGIGALLALLGQIYQTGADSWELFLWWAVLLLPWAWTAGTVFLSLFWVFIVNVGIILYFLAGGQALGLNLDSPGLEPSLILFVVNSGLLVLWERYGHNLGDRWRTGPRLLAAAALGSLMAAVLACLDASPALPLHAMAVLSAGVTALFYWIYTAWRPDSVIVVLAALTLFGVIAIDGLGLAQPGRFEWVVLGAIAVILALTGAVLYRLGRPRAAAQQDKQARAHPPVDRQTARNDWFIDAFCLLAMSLTATLIILFLFFTLDLDIDQGWRVGVPLAVVGVFAINRGSGVLLRETGAALAAAGFFLLCASWYATDALSANARLGVIPGAGLFFYILAHHFALRFFIAALTLGSVLILTWSGTFGAGILEPFYVESLGAALSVSWRTLVLAAAALTGFGLSRFPRVRALYLPAAWAFACAAQLLAVMAPATFAMYLGAGTGAWPWIFMASLAGVLLPVALLVFLLARDVSANPGLRRIAPWLLGMAGLCWMGAPGIALALIWLLTGFAWSRRTLWVFGVVSLLAYLAQFYYRLDMTLLHKSMLLGLSGAILMVFWALAVRACAPDTPRRAFVPARSAADTEVPDRPVLWRVTGLVGGLILVLAYANVDRAQKQAILASGQRVVLALAPVDPRSLIQGDYMALHFAVADRFQKILLTADAPAREEIRRQRRGCLVLRADAHNVARLHAVQAKCVADSAQEGVLLEFRLRGLHPYIVTDAYFFPEGQGRRYEPAVYGEFRVRADGTGLLTGLLDAQMRPL